MTQQMKRGADVAIFPPLAAVATPTTKILAIGNVTAKGTPDAIAPVLPFEVRATVRNYLAGKIEEIRRYCETDVLNTYLLYLRFQLLRGTLSAGQYASEVSLAREKIIASKEPHWREFLSAWDANAVS